MDGEHSGPLEAFYGLGEGKGWRKGGGKREEEEGDREEEEKILRGVLRSLLLSKGGGLRPHNRLFMRLCS